MEVENRTEPARLPLRLPLGQGEGHMPDPTSSEMCKH